MEWIGYIGIGILVLLVLLVLVTNIQIVPQGACKIHSCRRTVWKEYGRYDPERVRCKGIISGPAESRNLRKRQLY